MHSFDSAVRYQNGYVCAKQFRTKVQQTNTWARGHDTATAPNQLDLVWRSAQGTRLHYMSSRQLLSDFRFGSMRLFVYFWWHSILTAVGSV